MLSWDIKCNVAIICTVCNAETKLKQNEKQL